MVNALNRTRCKRDRAAAPVFPDDLLLWEIFVRLPAKEILRCRVACQSWRRLTCDAEFLLAHHHRQLSVPLVSLHPRINTNVNASVDAFYLRQTPAVSRSLLGFDDYTDRRDFIIHGSCDVLLLLSLGNGRFYICNPATRQWLALPALNGGNVAALYPHRRSGEYRVLYWKNRTSDSSSVVYYVLTVGSSDSDGPRCIGLPVASPSMKSDWGLWSNIRACKYRPTLLHDCLHWCVNGIVVAFDTLVESFKWMESPIDTNDSPHLFQTDGMFVFNNGDMLVTVWFSESCFPMTPPRSFLIHSDSKGMLKKKYKWDNVNPMVLGLCFKESLVRHVFFQRKDAAGRVRVPRFFRGL